MNIITYGCLSSDVNKWPEETEQPLNAVYRKFQTITETQSGKTSPATAPDSQKLWTSERMDPNTYSHVPEPL